jgi:hypothetical protein
VSTEVEVWSLLVYNRTEGPPVVTVHANEDECVEFFRECYDPEGEGQDMEFNDLVDSLSMSFAIDVHKVTIPEVDRLSTPGKTYDHEAAPDSMPGPGDTCKHCGEDITWMGPSMSDWLHVDDKENR